MPILTDPKTTGGPLTAADLTAARQHSTGNVHKLRSYNPLGPGLLPAGLDQQGRHPTRGWGPAEACTELGADTRPAALSMERHRKTAGRVVLALLAVPALAALVAVGGFVAQHLYR